MCEHASTRVPPSQLGDIQQDSSLLGRSPWRPLNRGHELQNWCWTVIVTTFYFYHFWMSGDINCLSLAKISEILVGTWIFHGRLNFPRAPEFTDFYHGRPCGTTRPGRYGRKSWQAGYSPSLSYYTRRGHHLQTTPARTERSQLLWTLPGQNSKEMLHWT